MFMIIATAITTPSTGSRNQTAPMTPITTAKIAPLIRPTRASRRMTRQTFELVRSRVAIARTATVNDCVPAFPPMEATIGIKTAKATNSSIVPSNSEITSDAKIAVTRFTASHGNRCLVVSITRSDRLPSPTPARRIKSSSASSSMKAIASSMVMTPTMRSSSSTTGAVIMW